MLTRFMLVSCTASVLTVISLCTTLCATPVNPANRSPSSQFSIRNSDFNDLAKSLIEDNVPVLYLYASELRKKRKGKLLFSFVLEGQKLKLVGWFSKRRSGKSYDTIHKIATTIHAPSKVNLASGNGLGNLKLNQSEVRIICEYLNTKEGNSVMYIMLTPKLDEKYTLCYDISFKDALFKDVASPAFAPAMGLNPSPPKRYD